MSYYQQFKKAVGIILALPLILPLLAIGVVIRLANEITARTVGVGIVVCPHCGVPAIVETNNPKVMR